MIPKRVLRPPNWSARNAEATTPIGVSTTGTLKKRNANINNNEPQANHPLVRNDDNVGQVNQTVVVKNNAQSVETGSNNQKQQQPAAAAAAAPPQQPSVAVAAPKKSKLKLPKAIASNLVPIKNNLTNTKKSTTVIEQHQPRPNGINSPNNNSNNEPANRKPIPNKFNLRPTMPTAGNGKSEGSASLKLCAQHLSEESERKTPAVVVPAKLMLYGPALRQKFQEESLSERKFKELYRDFPLKFTTTNAFIESIPLSPPPYCSPPSPVPLPSAHISDDVTKQIGLNWENKSTSEHHVDEDVGQKQQHPPQQESVQNITTKTDDDDDAIETENRIQTLEASNKPNLISTQALVHHIAGEADENSAGDETTTHITCHISRASSSDQLASPKMLPHPDANGHEKPKYASNLFENIPVRPRKGVVAHLDNYCLFDPSIDFFNEKEHKRMATRRRELTADQQQQQFNDQLIYDTLEEVDEDVEVVPETAFGNVDSANYFLVDPDLLDEEDRAYALYPRRKKFQTTCSTIPEDDNLNKSSSSHESSNSDYPRLNSTMGTTPSSTMESTTDEYGSSDSGPPKAVPLQRSKSNVDVIAQQSSYYGIALKKAPQIDKLFRQTASLPSSPVHGGRVRKTFNKIKSDCKKFPFESIKPSHSLPQLNWKCSNNGPVVRGRTMQKPMVESHYVLFNPAPVPSRSQYKVRRHQRPLSSHSDADSGFLSPVTPDGPSDAKFNTNSIVVLEQCDSIQGLIEIYTDWANYYLDRTKCKKKVVDLSTDCRDGILLAEVIEAVTSFKVPDLVKKPKTQQQMFNNVNSCLNILRQQSVGGLENITANDICSGRLKAVLSLFFALSRYKQATKQKAAATTGGNKQSVEPTHNQQSTHVVVVNDNMTNRQLPVPYAKGGANGGTAIPLPATVLVTRRCPPDKVRPLPPTPNHQQTSPPLNGKQNHSPADSRPNSPPYNSSQIPKGQNGLRQPQPVCKIPTSPYASNANIGQNVSGNTSINSTTKHSMLDKLKLFNKEKSDRSTKTPVSKRTSSSSGFSSARSERSDSSVSLNEGQDNVFNGANTKSSAGFGVGNKKPESAANNSKLVSSKPKSILSSSKSGSKDAKGKKGEKEVDTQIPAVPKLQKPATSPSSTTKLMKPSSTAGRKLETKSESRTSLTSLNQSQTGKTLMQPAGTGIPKPMAAIKGTTKQINNAEVSSPEKHVSDHNKQPVGNSNHINGSQLQQSNISSIMTDSLHSNSTHSVSTGHQSNSSESSVIYRPSSESGSDMYHSAKYPNPIPNRKLDNHHPPFLISNTTKREIGDGNSMMNGTGAGKYNTVPSKLANEPIIYEHDDKPNAVQPMRPLLRGYNSHVTLPIRGSRGNIMADYGDEMAQQGYCSDGDALRKLPARYNDGVENGYMSEGGTPTKHFMSLMRARTQLPTTIEERCRASREDIMDRMGTNGQENGLQLNEPAPSPTSSRKDKGSPNHSRRNASNAKASRTKGVPQSFGYIKRPNGTTLMSPQEQAQQPGTMMGSGGRTAHVSAVPRSNKVKVSGGTQTTTADFSQKIQPNQYRSYSLTGPNAAQLSQSVKERFGSGTNSLPKPGLDMHAFQHRIANRGSVKLMDGSLSDTQTYAEVKTDYSSYAMWLKHSNTASSRLSEGDSMDQQQQQQHQQMLAKGASNSMGRNQLMMQRDAQQMAQSPRLNRSNSIRSTKSEKMYPSMMSRGPDVEIEPYYCLPVGAISNGVMPWSQPTSPTPPNNRSSFSGLMSPTHSNGHRLTYPKKNDDVHSSQASLLSGGSSLYGSTEERQATEVRRLKRELADAREHVYSLSGQLSANAHVVSAFEQSLTNMTSRLQSLTATTEKKDSEILEMRQTIELLRKQSIQAGLTTAHMQSMGGNQINGNSTLPTASSTPKTASLNSVATDPHSTTPPLPPANGSSLIPRHHSSESMCSINSISSGSSAQDKKKKKGWLRSSFNLSKAFSRNAKISKTSRHYLTNDLSVNTTIPETSICGTLPPSSPANGSPMKMSQQNDATDADATEVHPIVEDLKKQLREKDLVLTDIRLEALSSASQLENLKDTVQQMRQEMMSLKQNNERLQRMVTTRSLAGSEASLGHHSGTPASPSGSIGEPRRYSLAENGMSRQPLDLPTDLDELDEENIPPAPAPEPPPEPLSPSAIAQLCPAMENPADIMSMPAEEVADPIDGKKISIAVYLGQPESFTKYIEELIECDNLYSSGGAHDENGHNGNGLDNSNKSFPDPGQNEFVVAYTYISGKTTWQNLDYIVRKTFKDYLSRIDPGTNLGLNTDSITSYHLGEAKRGPEMGFPELLPCGYIIGSVKTLHICLQGVGCLAFDCLIPRSIAHRYISLLTEHRRLILCGPSGTGKSFLARKLAEFLVAKSGRGNPAEAIATFNVDHKSSKELQQYLSHVAEQASIANGACEELPSVIILDNLHHASALGDVFSCLLSSGVAAKLPCIIGTMSQATCNTTNLQLHHNFRWVLTANHMEPVKGFLGRFLRRRLFQLELQTQSKQVQLEKVFKWLPTVWQHINTFLETHSSSDVTIGPRLFLACPLEQADSQVWFQDVWNYHLAPYLVEAVREGVQLYGRRGGVWIDPCQFVRETYPWPVGPTTVPTLRQISADDVGLEAGAPSVNDSQDPLLNMLMRLQEAANYNGNQEQDSDCASLDSNLISEQESLAGAE